MNDRNKVNGQSMVETLIVLPIMTLGCAAVVQLLLIFWQQQTVAMAAQYALRAGSLNHARTGVMKTTFAAVMAGLKPQLDNPDSLVDMSKALLQQRLHLAKAGKLERLLPTAKHFKRYAERRWLPGERRWVKELAVDHLQARARRYAGAEREYWEQAHTIAITGVWCMPLEIPLAAELLVKTQSWFSDSDAQRFCRLRAKLFSQPLWALPFSAQQALMSGFRNQS